MNFARKDESYIFVKQKDRISEEINQIYGLAHQL
jgi:hypothetical protein